MHKYLGGSVCDSLVLCVGALLEIIAASSEVKFALCLAAKNENLDIAEWIEYHISIGVKHILVFDVNSDVPMFDIVKPYIMAGTVKYTYLNTTDVKHMKIPSQFFVYNNLCLGHYKHQYTHIGMIDTDEFIVITDPQKTIEEALEPYKDYAGLVLNWKMFNSHGHVARPKSGVLQNYGLCRQDKHVKSIVNTRYTIETKTPHHFLYKDDYYAVDTNFRRVNGPFNAVSSLNDTVYDYIYVNHYNTKSVEDFIIKNQRDAGDGGRKTFTYFVDFHKMKFEKCGVLSKREH